MDRAIETMRAFNRFFTRHVGAMDARFLGSDMNLTEARLLFEIARQEPISANRLQAEMGLDRGYLSRMIGLFEKREWIRRDRLQTDARLRPISLTQRGREIFDEVDKRQRDAVSRDLSRLNAAQQDELVQALTKAQQLLGHPVTAPSLPASASASSSSSTSIDMLDRPVWNALTGRQAPFALGDNAGLRFAPEYGPFAAPCDPSGDLTSLAHMAKGDDIWLVEKNPIVPPTGLTLVQSAECVQMVAHKLTHTENRCEHAFADLGEEDAADMRALAALTKPGPFSTKTQNLGGFIGIRKNGILVAMAGERMKPGRYTELSGVCTHPDHRGRGYAGTLMRIVTSRILQRGETAFLHCYESNTGAIALYQSLGFEIHQTVTAMVLTPTSP